MVCPYKSFKFLLFIHELLLIAKGILVILKGDRVDRHSITVTVFLESNLTQISGLVVSIEMLLIILNLIPSHSGLSFDLLIFPFF